MRFPAVDFSASRLNRRLAEGLALLVVAAGLIFMLWAYLLAGQSDDSREAAQRLLPLRSTQLSAAAAAQAMAPIAGE